MQNEGGRSDGSSPLLLPYSAFCTRHSALFPEVRPMIRHDPVLPPEFIYPIDDWRWVERRFSHEFVGQSETTFSVANGYLGLRGNQYEGSPTFLHGTFVNGYYETWPIPYGEKAYG